MPTLWLSSFDWNQFGVIIDQPTAFANRLAMKFQQNDLPKDLSDFAIPQTEAGIAEFIDRLFRATDWYAGKSPREARTIDGVLAHLFEEASSQQAFAIKPINDGLMMEILEIATGRAHVDESRITSTSKVLFVRKAEPSHEDHALELASLGARPFRSASWDRVVATDLLRRHNPFVEGIDAAYFPEYSIHSPSEVEQLRIDLGRIGDRVRSALAPLKSKRVREGAIANFEGELARPIETAARARLALIARWDY